MHGGVRQPLQDRPVAGLQLAEQAPGGRGTRGIAGGDADDVAVDPMLLDRGDDRSHDRPATASRSRPCAAAGRST
jgi:hypothetical protein